MNIDEIWTQFEDRVRKALKADHIEQDAKLTELGMNSIMVMKFASFLRRKGIKLNFGELINSPTLGEWKCLAEAKASGEENEEEEIRDVTGKAAENSGRDADVKTAGKPEEVLFDLTDVQYAYWAGRQDDQELGGVGCHAYFEFDGTGDDESRLRSAWFAVQDAHPMLHAVFTEDGKQRINASNTYLEPVFHDFRNMNASEAQENLLKIRRKLSHEKLRVEIGENAHLEAAFMKDGKRRIFLDVDLLVADVASVHLLIMDLTRAYSGETLHRYDPDCFKRYLDKRSLDRATEGEDEKYWKDKLTGFPEEPISLPLRVKPEEVKKNHFVRISKSFKEEVWSTLKNRAAGYGLSPAMLLLTAYAKVLSRYSGQEKFLINIPLFNRFDDDPETEGMVADFTNLLLLNTENAANMTFLQYAEKIRSNFSSDVSHSSYSGVKVERELSKYSGNIRNMAPVVFACNIDFPFETEKSRDVLGKLTYMISQTPQVWLDFQSFTDMGKLILCWDYVEELFDKEVIEDMFGSLTEEIEKLYNSENWDEVIDVLPGKQKIRHEKEENILPLKVENISLLSGFVRNAANSPDAQALISGDDSKITTYGELAGIAGSIAAYLRKYGIEKGDYIAVTLPRGYRQIYAILGILYAGAVYVPVSVNQPADRRLKIYEQIGINCVISDSETAGSTDLACENVIDLDEAMACNTKIPAVINPDDSAYVIMTSGSTGIPKGVEIVHKAAMNTIKDLCERYNFKAEDRMLMVSAIDFDLSVFDIFGMLYAGGAVVIPEEDIFKNPDVWLQLMDKYGINRWNSVPILFDMLITYAEGKKKKVMLDTVFMSGDWIPITLPGRFYDISGENSLVISMGGATEASIWSNYQEVPRVIPDHWPSIPYGRPLKNQLYRVMDDYGSLCPDYVPGELCIGGAGVAKCYRGDTDLTDKKYYTDKNGIRWYRTGDNGRTWSDGTIEFLGRRDNQVKVKGHRIELGEIENAIKQYPGVRGAAVLAADYSGKGKRIAAFIQSESKEFEGIKDFTVSGFEFTEEEIKRGTERLQQVAVLSDDFIRKAIENNQDSDSEIIKYWKSLDISSSAEDVPDIEENRDIRMMYENVGHKLPDMLSGKLNPIEYFYDLASEYRPDQLLEKHKETEKAHNIVKSIIDAFPKRDDLRVLELGGRNPKLTKDILDILAGRLQSYTYLENTEFYRFGFDEISREYSEFEYMIGDLNKLFEDGEVYDIVIIPESLHRLKDIDDAVKKIGEMTAAGGLTVGCEPSGRLKTIITIPAILENGFSDINLEERGGSVIPDRRCLDKAFTVGGYEKIYISGEAEESAALSVVYAYMKCREDALSMEGLKAYLEKEIPSYMIPFKFYRLEEFPLNKNGKIDRKKLLQMIKEYSSSDEGEERSGEPATDTERYISETLGKALGAGKVGRYDNFFSLGGDSLSATKLIAALREEKHLQVSIRNIFENPVVKDLSQYIDDNKESLSIADEAEFAICKEDWDKPFPLTGVQFAYWIGRKGAFSLGNVATHCYYEYECDHINIPVFQKIWNDMVEYHGMLRAVIGSDGMQRIESSVPYYMMETLHAENLTEDEKRNVLENVRNSMASQVIDTEKWPLFDIRITVLSDEKTVVHISFDNIILDGFSMFHLLDEMAERYSEAVSGKLHERRLPEISFRDYVMNLEKRRASSEYEADKKYWSDRLDKFSRAPLLPIRKSEDEIKVPEFKRRQFRLSPKNWEALKEAAKSMEVTPSVFIIAAYSDILRKVSRNKSFSLNLTQFGRNINHEDADKIVGDFTLLTLLEVKNLRESTFTERCKSIGRQLTEDMEHPLYSAVEFERELRQRDNNPVNSIMPIVFTSGIGVNEWREDKSIGRLTYNISQTPQVWIDHQVFEQEGGLTLNWDSVDELLSKELLDSMFRDYITHLTELVENPAKREEISVSEDADETADIGGNVETSKAAGGSYEKPEDESISGDYIEKVSDIWSEVLGEKVTDMDKSFFELGGDSLGIVKMINLISEEYSAELSIIDIINNNSVKKVAGLLENVVQEGII